MADQHAVGGEAGPLRQDPCFHAGCALGVGHDASYYRTSAGAEVDLVLEGTFGLVAVEVKHTSTVSARELRGVRDFVREQKARLGLVITNDTTARLLDDRLVSLPFAWL